MGIDVPATVDDEILLWQALTTWIDAPNSPPYFWAASMGDGAQVPEWLAAPFAYRHPKDPPAPIAIRGDVNLRHTAGLSRRTPTETSAAEDGFVRLGVLLTLVVILATVAGVLLASQGGMARLPVAARDIERYATLHPQDVVASAGVRGEIAGKVAPERVQAGDVIVVSQLVTPQRPIRRRWLLPVSRSGAARSSRLGEAQILLGVDGTSKRVETIARDAILIEDDGEERLVAVRAREARAAARYLVPGRALILVGRAPP
jgi:hypothetical protein